jgi:MSHA biogenesis protein MshI
MSLSTWFALPARAHAARAWVGVQAQAGRYTMARLDASRLGRRPRVLACQCVASAAGPSALRGWWRAHAHKGDAAALLLEAGDYQLLQIQAPAVEPTEQRSAARWQIKDLIDFPVEEAAIDCFAAPGDAQGSSGARLNVVVARQALVAQALGAWRAAGLRLKVIDIPDMALRNVALLAAGDAACAFLHVGIDDARLLLLWREELCVARHLPLAGRQLQGTDSEQWQRQVERLALEVQRSVDAFGRQFSAASLGQLWVSSVHDTKRLADALAAQVGLQVLPFVAEDWIDFDAGAGPFDLRLGVDHLPAIGAALREGGVT